MPFDIQRLRAVKNLSRNSGCTVLLTDSNNEKVVFKMQAGPIASQQIAGAVLKRAGVASPVLTPVDDARRYIAAINRHAPSMITEEDAATYTTAFLMTYVDGRTPEAYLDEQAREFVSVLCNATFQESLGRMLAADVMCGNNDRILYANRSVNYNPGNFVIDEATKSVVAIDNAFTPDNRTTANMPSGVRGMYRSIGAMSVSIELAKLEARALLDRFLFELSGKGIKDALDQTQQDNFVKTVAEAAKKQLSEFVAKKPHVNGEREKDWKKLIHENHGSQAVYKEFTLFKRTLRHMEERPSSDFVNLETAQPVFKDWMLKNGYGNGKSLSGSVAEEALAAWKAPPKGDQT